MTNTEISEASLLQFLSLVQCTDEIAIAGAAKAFGLGLSRARQVFKYMLENAYIIERKYRVDRYWKRAFSIAPQGREFLIQNTMKLLTE